MSLVYRKEIDGLRAFAVIPVIFFHSGFEVFKKGFVGVDIFFVISGYLITSIIIKNLINKSFSIKFFFERRARRILPALYLVIITTIPFAWIFLSRDELTSYSKSLIATTIFLSNFFFWKETPYFESEAELKPLLHTWSLSIEEQFYIFFPFILIFIWKFKKSLIIYALQIIFIVSLLICFWGLKNAPNENFYFTLTRIWEFSIGAIAAYLIIKNRFNFSKQLNNILSLFGFGIIVYSIFFYNFSSNQIPTALFPIIGTVLIIIFSNKGTLVEKFLSTKIFVGIGIISYSLYLWHYPILAFAKNYYNEINLQLKFLIILLSFILSTISYKFIEKPFRDNNFISLKNFINLMICATLFFIIFSFLTFSYFEKYGNGPKLAKLLSENNAIFGISMDERIFIKSRINYENFNPKILVIGSSRTMQLGEKELKDKTLNFSVSGASIEDHLVITELALDKFNPTTIYLGADPWLFNKYNNQKRWQSLKSEYDIAFSNVNSWSRTVKKINFNKKKIVKEETKIARLTFSENIFEKVYNTLNINPNFIISSNILNELHKTIILRDGKRVYDLKHSNQKKESEIIRYSMYNYEFSTDQFENYDNFLDYLKNYHKKEVVLVLTPYYEPSFKLTINEMPVYLDIEKKFMKLASKHKIKIVGSYDPKLADCEIGEFYDSMHPKDDCMKKLIK
jgi:peptidoglycan/LPS O-acetylase OafA/YrhL